MTASASVARRAVVINPFIGSSRTISRPALRAGAIHLSDNARNIQVQNPAFALLITIRNVTTEPNRGSASTGLPPGFNAQEAKKPLPRGTSDASMTVGKAKEMQVKAAENDPTTAAAEDAKAVTELAERKDVVVADKGKKEGKKLTIMQKIKKEARHYWDGSKLLATEVKISTRLALRMAAGYELTRRENRQLQRTVKDLGRLVPFSAFVIIPFAELLLPVALKLFPNLLPSTFEDQKSKDKKASTLRALRKEVSHFLRHSIKETGLALTPATTQKEEFTNFFRKVRATGQKPTTEDVIKVCKAFRDDLTLDNLSRPQLVSMCRYMNLNTFGTDQMLRYQVRHRMRQIKRDDHAISYEGVDSLTVAELQMACASRGIKTHGVSPARLREDLQTWLDLRLKEGVPSTLLVLSSAYMYGQSGDDAVANQIDALIGVLSSIPEELYHEIELEVHSAEGAATNKQRLEVLKEQEELIEDESEQNASNQTSGLATPRDVEDIDEDDKLEGPMNAKEAGLEEKKQVNETIDAEKKASEADKVTTKNGGSRREI